MGEESAHKHDNIHLCFQATCSMERAYDKALDYVDMNTELHLGEEKVSKHECGVCKCHLG